MNVDLLQDGLSSLLWLMIWIGIAWSFQRRKKLKGKERQLFWLAFVVKIAAGITYGMYFMVFQQQGDSFEYYHCLQLLWAEVKTDPGRYFHFLLASPGDPSFPYHIYFTQGSPLAMLKVGFVLSVFAFNSFWGMSICLSGLVFFASWFVFKGWRSRFDATSWWGAFCLFFLPSVLFWGTGWGKDGILWLAICMVIGGLLGLQKQQPKQLEKAKQMGLVGLGSFLIAYLKAPLMGIVLFAILVGILIATVNHTRIRARIGIYVGFVGLILFVLFWQQGFFIELISYQRWHTDAFNGGQSAFQIPEIQRIRELLFYLPYLACSGLFRPTPWEWGHPLVTIGGIEVLGILVALGIWGWQRGVRPLLKSLFTSPFALSLLIFALCLATASILFSQNFGTLLRYRMPALALFLLSFWPIRENS